MMQAQAMQQQQMQHMHMQHMFAEQQGSPGMQQMPQQMPMQPGFEAVGPEGAAGHPMAIGQGNPVSALAPTTAAWFPRAPLIYCLCFQIGAPGAPPAGHPMASAGHPMGAANNPVAPGSPGPADPRASPVLSMMDMSLEEFLEAHGAQEVLQKFNDSGFDDVEVTTHAIPPQLDVQGCF